MDGVTILQTIPAVTNKEYIIVIITVLFLIILGGVLVLKFEALLAGVALMACGLILSAQGVHPHPKQYKITVDNTISYNEFTAKYNIIETDGKIITVEEKDNGKNSD